MASAVVVRQRGNVAELHALDPFADGALAGPQVWWCQPTDAAIVLGSRQPHDLVDPEACRRAGLAVVRRRSGGGVVTIRPDAVVWIDLVIPSGLSPEAMPDPPPDDIRGSMVWAGRHWQAAITAGAIDPPTRSLIGPDTSVHEGAMVPTPWSELVCFAGLGPGEVLVGEHKLVGLSQRRNRHGIRVQGLVHRRSLSAEVEAVLAAARPDAPLPDPACLPGLDAETVALALAARITRH